MPGLGCGEALLWGNRDRNYSGNFGERKEGMSTRSADAVADLSAARQTTGYFGAVVDTRLHLLAVAVAAAALVAGVEGNEIYPAKAEEEIFVSFVAVADTAVDADAVDGAVAALRNEYHAAVEEEIFVDLADVGC